jgi:hypothetical protein
MVNQLRSLGADESMPPEELTPEPAQDAAPPAADGALLAESPDAGTAIGHGRRGRRGIESVFVRLIATTGIVGICTAVAAILGTQHVAAWIIGLVASVTSVVLAAILWSSRTL